MNLEELQGTPLARRDMLRIGAAGAVGFTGLGALQKAAAQQCATNPSQTQGPFWVEEMLNRSDIRPDSVTGILQPGLPLRLAINVSEIQAGICRPVAGAYVDIWHCSALGAYSDVSGGGNPNTLGQDWLRGYQATDDHGNVRFLTVYPGWYMGRTVHIHFRIRKFNGPVIIFNFTSQMYFIDAISDALYATTPPYSAHLPRSPASNQQDNLYNPALLLRLARNGDHALASFKAIINADPGMAMEMDEESIEHMNDFGGGSPPMRD